MADFQAILNSLLSDDNDTRKRAEVRTRSAIVLAGRENCAHVFAPL